MLRQLFAVACLTLLVACGVPQPDVSPANFTKTAILTENQDLLLKEAETAETFSTAQEGFAAALVLGAFCELADCNGFEILLAADLAVGIGSMRQDDSAMANNRETFRPTKQTLAAHTTYANRVSDRGDTFVALGRNVLTEARSFVPGLKTQLAATPQNDKTLSWVRKLLTLQKAADHLALWQDHRAKLVSRSLDMHDAAGLDVTRMAGASARINAQAQQAKAIANSFKVLVNDVPRKSLTASGGGLRLDLTLPPSDQ